MSLMPGSGVFAASTPTPDAGAPEYVNLPFCEQLIGNTTGLFYGYPSSGAVTKGGTYSNFPAWFSSYSPNSVLHNAYYSDDAAAICQKTNNQDCISFDWQYFHFLSWRINYTGGGQPAAAISVPLVVSDTTMAIFGPAWTETVLRCQ